MKNYQKYNLFLDDIREPSHCNYMPNASFYRTTEWRVVRDYSEFCNSIEVNFVEGKWPEIISFDHDLADTHYKDAFITADQYEAHYVGLEEKTGMDCAKWLVDFCIEHSMPLPAIHVHSQNTVGAANIRSYLNSYLKSLTL